MRNISSASAGPLAFAIVKLMFLLAPTASNAVGRNVINGVAVTVNNDNWGGPCPTEMRFTGTISVNPLPGAVLNYHWQRSDGAKTPIKVVRINRGQTEISVENAWTLGRQGFKTRIWQTLVVGSGNQHIRHRSKTIPISCQR